MVATSLSEVKENLLEAMETLTEPLTIVLFCLVIGLAWWSSYCQKTLYENPRYWLMSTSQKIFVFSAIFIVFPFLLLFGMLGDE